VKTPPIDKIAHALVSYGAVLTFALVLPLTWAVMLTLIAGALKEWYDFTMPEIHTADWNDFWADCAGAVAAVAVINILSIAL
jgi:hypothetical protein